MVLFGVKWLYSGKSGCIRAKAVEVGQSDCIREKDVVFGEVVLFGQKCIRVKLSLSVKSG